MHKPGPNRHFYKSFKMLRFVFSFAVVATSVQAIKWVPVSEGDTISSEAVVVDGYKGMEHYCKFTDNGVEFIGSLEKGGSVCIALSRDDSVVSESSNFNILSIENDEKIGWKYCGGQKVPSRAITCNETQALGKGDCFLGQGVYGDGICEERLGFIEDKYVNMVVSGKKSRCPFKLYLVENSQESTC